MIVADFVKILTTSEKMLFSNGILFTSNDEYKLNQFESQTIKYNSLVQDIVMYIKKSFEDM